jgi:hypothetical protein
VKNALEQLRIRAEQQQKEKPSQIKEGVPIGETMQITAQGRNNFIITLDMMFINEEETHRP